MRCSISMLAEYVLLSILAMLAVWRWFLLDIVFSREIVVIRDNQSDDDEPDGCDCCEAVGLG